MQNAFSLAMGVYCCLQIYYNSVVNIVVKG